MTTLRISTAMCLFVAAVAMGLLPVPALGNDAALDLLSIGQPEDSAIGLSVCTNVRPGDRAPKQGDRLVMSVQVDSDAYLTALSVSSQGSVTVLFPNKESTNPLLKKGKAYQLFGDDSRSRLMLGKTVPQPRLVLYLSTRRPSLDAFIASKEGGATTIPADSVKKLKALKEALEAVAGSQGFNRVVVSSTSDKKKHFEITLMESPGPLMGGRRPIQKKLPTSVDSTPPETVTGVQGVKPELPE